MPLTEENELAHRIIGFSIEIHKSLGPGLDKSIYRECLKNEMKLNGMGLEEDLSIDMQFKNLLFENAIMADFLVSGSVLLMVDDSEQVPESRVIQMLKMLRELNINLGLIINFNANLMRKGIRRVTQHKQTEASAGGLPEADGFES